MKLLGLLTLGLGTSVMADTNVLDFGGCESLKFIKSM